MNWTWSLTIFYVIHSDAWLQEKEFNVLKDIAKVVNKKESKYVALFNTKRTVCSDFVQYFLKKIDFPVVIFNEKTLVNKDLPKVKNVYVFLENQTELTDALEFLNSFYSMTTYSGYFYFVFCDQSLQKDHLVKLFEIVWKQSILNSIFVYYSPHFNVMSYNPFKKQLVNYTKSCRKENFLKDLNGYNLNVGICNDYPRNVVENNQTYGQDFDIFKRLMKAMNASVSYVNFSTCLRIRRGIEKELIDFSLVGHFVTDTLNVSYTYPQSMDDVIVLVPMAGTLEIYLNIFLAFGSKAWFCYVFLALITVSLTYLIERKLRNKRAKVMDAFFAVLTISLNNPLIKLSKKPPLIKFLLMAWCANCFLYNSLFNSSITSVYIKPNKSRNIRFLAELYETHLDIYLPYDLSRVIPEDNLLNNQFCYDSRERVIQYLIEGQLNAAFALPSSYIWNIYQNKLAKNGAMKRLVNRPKYTKLYERLIPGHKVYLFPNKSPYLEEIDRLLSIDKENGLSKGIPEFNGRGQKMKLRDVNKYTAFTLSHLQMSFYLFVVGIGLSLLVFIVEILSVTKIQHFFWRNS